MGLCGDNPKEGSEQTSGAEPDTQPGIAAGPTHGLITGGRDGVHAGQRDVRNPDEENDLPGNGVVDGQRDEDHGKQHERRRRKRKEDEACRHGTGQLFARPADFA